jgi:hypothetical protein
MQVIVISFHHNTVVVQAALRTVHVVVEAIVEA